MKTAALFPIILLASCASTTIYRDGKPIARFDGDMTNMVFHAAPDGSVDWTCANVSHSAATLAQGEAASKKMTSLGMALATSGAVAALK